MVKKGNFKENHKKKVNTAGQRSTNMHVVGKQKKKIDKNTIYAWILLVFFVFWTIAGILGSIAFFRKEDSAAVVANADDITDSLYTKYKFPESLSILNNKADYLFECDFETYDGAIPCSVDFMFTANQDGVMDIEIMEVYRPLNTLHEGIVYVLNGLSDSLIAWYGQVDYEYYSIGINFYDSLDGFVCGIYDWHNDEFLPILADMIIDGSWLNSGCYFAIMPKESCEAGILAGEYFFLELILGTNETSNTAPVFVYDLYDNLFEFGYALGYYNSIYDNRTNTFYMSNPILYCWNEDNSAVETIYDTPEADDGQINFGDYHTFALDELGHSFYRFDCVFEFAEELEYNPIGLSYYSFITENAELLAVMPQVFVSYLVNGVNTKVSVPWGFTDRNTATGLETEYFLDFSKIEIPYNAILWQVEYNFNDISTVFWEYDYDYFAQNYLAGYYQGFDAGETKGWNDGWSEGYSDGYEEASNHTFYSLIGAVVDVPIRAFMSLFNFEILGVNIANFALGIFSMCLVLAIIKLIL